MSRHAHSLAVIAVLSGATAIAQNRPFLFSTSQTEQTVSGSGGTVLRTLRPNEVSEVEFAPCPVSAEKWAPRTCYQTMAGDENSDATYFDPALFASIDALVDMPSPIAGGGSQRTVFWSPSAAMGTGVSGAPGLRPGDTGRIVRTGVGDGKVEYFLRAEDVQLSLGMPIIPVVVDVDAIAADPGYGVFFSLDQDTVVNTACGVTFVRDGDLLLIPASAITWTFDFRVAAVLPGSALVVYTEAQMDLFVQNAQVTDRFGNCVMLIQDLEALDIDYSGPVGMLPGCTGVAYPVPSLLFTGELMTGASVLTTAGGGQIYVAGCGPLGRSCGTGPTLGLQMGLRPPSAAVGVPSYVSALTSTFAHRFVIEPQQHVFLQGNPAQLDVYSPAPFNWIFFSFAPTGINAVAPSFSFPNSYFPDAYVSSWIGTTGGPGFSTYTSPVVPFACKLVWQGVTILGSQIVLSTPATTDVL